ncbi:GntR family transcriptional regulator [Thalassoroseus pseudoceratinae]|uniref:GntR family transcriptional regulator n=1 Tax=Thalassoroseus pseudoceratinae TaxID=2713176 RepID=UPI0014208CA2|nr:substrate-binding domain-containing protein [Thalassoroseus pseudoceratinae]
MYKSKFSSGFPELQPIRGESGRPKYERLKDYIVGQIESGELEPGAMLPSEHRLAEVLEIARSTVRQAMGALERDGLIRRIHGKGTFVNDQVQPRSGREQNLFALIVPETQTGFYPAFQCSFEDAAAGVNSQVIVCNSNNDVDKQGNTILQLIDRQVAGVAIVPTAGTKTPAFHIRQLQQHGIPVVCCSRPVEGVKTPWLRIPFEDVGRRAGEALSRAGHSRVAFIASFRSAAAEAYEAGLRAALSQAEDTPQIQAFYASGPSPDVSQNEDEVASAIEEMFLRKETSPTAIFTSFDSLAELIYVLLAKKGLRVPEDVSLVSFGGSQRIGALACRLTSVTVDEAQLGREAITLLEQMKRGDLRIDAAETRVLPLGLSNGSTLRLI